LIPIYLFSFSRLNKLLPAPPAAAPLKKGGTNILYKKSKGGVRNNLTKGGEIMITKRLLILLVAIVFTLSVAGLSFSAQEVKGTVTKIEGSRLTIMDDVGKEKIVKVKDQESLKEIKVGDRVSIKDGMLTKEAVESSKPYQSPK